MKYAQQKPEETKSTIPRPERLWILSRVEGDYPVQTILNGEKAGASRQKEIAHLFLAMEDGNEEVPEEAIAILENISDDEITKAWTVMLQEKEALPLEEPEEISGEDGGDEK